MKASLTIRYVGSEDFARRFLLQRQDGQYYTGRGWTACLAKARLYDRLSTVEKIYHTLQNRQFRGQPKRKFRMYLNLTVFGTGRFSADDLRRFLEAAMHVNFDTTAAGDGPSSTFVQAVSSLWSLEEIVSDAVCLNEAEPEQQ